MLNSDIPFSPLISLSQGCYEICNSKYVGPGAKPLYGRGGGDNNDHLNGFIRDKKSIKFEVKVNSGSYEIYHQKIPFGQKEVSAQTD